MSKFKKFGDFSKAKESGLAGKEPVVVTHTAKDPIPFKAPKADDTGILMAAGEDGLGHTSTPGMTPDKVNVGEKVDAKVQFVKSHKMKTEEFIKKTKEMTNEEFVSFILESRGQTELTTVSDLFGNEFTPDANQSINYVVGLIMGNPALLETFVREVKRRDGLKEVMSELMEHNDTYELLIDGLEEPEFGSDRTSKIAKMMNERFMKHYDNFDFGDEEGFDESVSPGIDDIMAIEKPATAGSKNGMQPSGQSGKSGGSFGGGSMDNTPSPNYKGGVFGNDNTGGKNGMHEPKSGGSVMGGASAPDFTMSPKKMKEGSERPKFKGKSAGHNLINEMASYPGFKKHMLDTCQNC